MFSDEGEKRLGTIDFILLFLGLYLLLAVVAIVCFVFYFFYRGLYMRWLSCSLAARQGQNVCLVQQTQTLITCPILPCTPITLTYRKAQTQFYPSDLLHR